MRPVCVIGTGLVGGSVLRAATAAGRPCWGATKSEVDVQAAQVDGFAVDGDREQALRRAVDEDALVVLAVPLPALRETVRQVAWYAPECWLTDVISVKEPVAAEIRELLPGARYAGGHPMAGVSTSGWAASSGELFAGAPWAVTIEESTDVEAWREAASLALDCGARVVPTSDAEHDSAVARVSHLPHVFSAILAAVGADGGPLALSLAAGSFRDGTRVSSSDPELVRAMTEGNRVALLDAVDDALGRLGAARGALASTGGLKSTVDSGYAARGTWHQLGTGERSRTRIDLTTRNALRRLRDLGERGGRITELSGDTAIGELPLTR